MKVSKIFVRGVAVAALLAFCAAPALAPGGMWWLYVRFRRELGLTFEQGTRLE